MKQPVQIILDPSHFIGQRTSRGGGGCKDFFENKDSDFLEHKKNLSINLCDLAEVIERSPFGKTGYIKVTLRKKAWAKSHRPLKELFIKELSSYIGNGDLGVMYIRVTPEALVKIARKVLTAEDHPKKDKGEAKPTRIRSEVGAVQTIEIYPATDKRSFSLEDSLFLFSQDGIPSMYDIELFEDPPLTTQTSSSNNNVLELFKTLNDGVRKIGNFTDDITYTSKPSSQIPELSLYLNKRVLSGDSDRDLNIPSISLLDSDTQHQKLLELLEFLDKHPLVRRIRLPGRIVNSSQLSLPYEDSAKLFKVPTKDINRTYPKIGIIDGGITQELDEWIIGQYSNLDNTDVDLNHGTFIAGITCFGKKLNKFCLEPDGVEIFDIAIHPKSTTQHEYYGNSPNGFFDELEEGIKEATKECGIRIFNLSININQETSLSSYSEFAARLDHIADQYDCLFFISGGNLKENRAEWKNDPISNLKDLASSLNDRVYIPAESIRNISTAALNPPQLPYPNVGFGLASYSRRGPGTRCGNKPDFAHVGGSGIDHGIAGSGLKSIQPNLVQTTGRGTSYSAPLVARTAAQIEHEIISKLPLETIKALLIHSAELPPPFRSKEYTGLARDLVGFGMPKSADEILMADEHQITMVFETNLKKGQSLDFKFTWPKSLTQNGKCRGSIKLTLVAKPPLDTKFGAEFVRINISASLQQENRNTQTGETQWIRKIDPTYTNTALNPSQYEADQIKDGLKWSNIKLYEKEIKQGVGKSSNWKLCVNYLTRAEEELPDAGVPFSMILSIEDLDKKHNIFNEVKQELNARNITVQDIKIDPQIKV